MRQRRFGPLERDVPIIGQGTWNVPLRGADRAEAIRALRRGVELGLVHVDSAEMYGDGAAEEVVREALHDLGRERLFLVSKVLPEHATFAGTIRACEASLRRLGTDYLDVYLLHWRGNVPLAETLGALERLVADGKIRALGVSNFDAEDLAEAQAALTRERLACNQVLYHLGERSIEQHEVAWCREHDVAIVGYTPFGRGAWEDAPGMHVLEEIAAAHAATPRQIVLAFLTRDGAFVIPKASTVAHVEENAGAGDLVLSADEIAAIDAAYPVRRRRGGLPTL